MNPRLPSLRAAAANPAPPTQQRLARSTTRHAHAGAGAREGWESDSLVFWPLDTLSSCPHPLTPVTTAAVRALGTLPAVGVCSYLEASPSAPA